MVRVNLRSVLLGLISLTALVQGAGQQLPVDIKSTSSANAAESDTKSGYLVPLFLGEGYVVRDRPFVVEVETTWSGTTWTPSGRAVSRAMRDKEGRQRLEFPVNQEASTAGQQPEVEIYDPTADRIIKLNLREKTAAFYLLRPVDVPMVLPIEEEARKAGVGDPIGKRTILGRETEGFRKLSWISGATQPLIQDVWFYTYKATYLPLMAENDDLTYGKVVRRVVLFDASDPDPALFEVPAGYRVVDEAAIR